MLKRHRRGEAKGELDADSFIPPKVKGKICTHSGVTTPIGVGLQPWV